MNAYAGLYKTLDCLTEKKESVRLAIDGRCASGKTTLAGLLAERYDASIIHTDDFFLPAGLRTSRRYLLPGGNIHFERFLYEVLPGLKSGKAFSYRRFDCSAMNYGGYVKILPKPLMIIEGAYCLRPDFREIYDYKVFMDVPAEEQARRIKERNGEAAYINFQKYWIPLEEEYIEKLDIVSQCDLRL